MFESRGRGSNPYEPFGSQDFKSCASTNFTTPGQRGCTDLGVALLNCYQKTSKQNGPSNGAVRCERETRLELATSTLARLRSTN
jgi:hypothetical protein